MQIDANVTLGADDTVTCSHCGAQLGHAPDRPLANALRHERPSVAAGPGVRVRPEQFTDRRIVLRQTFCPACLTLLATEIVPADEPSYRMWSVHR